MGAYGVPWMGSTEYLGMEEHGILGMGEHAEYNGMNGHEILEMGEL